MHISKRAAGFHEPLAAEAAPWTDDAMSLFEWFRRARPEVVDAALGPSPVPQRVMVGACADRGRVRPDRCGGRPGRTMCRTS